MKEACGPELALFVQFHGIEGYAPALVALALECKGCPGTFCKGCHGTGHAVPTLGFQYSTRNMRLYLCL